MDVSVTFFSNPFSIFMKEKTLSEIDVLKHEDHAYGETHGLYTKKHWSDVNHGKYVAVWHQNQWTRGIVHMESQVLIWLVDCGYYVRPDDSMVYVDLPGEFKKMPTKVFEASIHGVVPVDKVLSGECEIKHVISTTWNHGSIEKGQSIISRSRAIYFVPVALMSTKGNDVVLGDLYVDIPSEGVVNFVDLMELWPVHLQKDPSVYIDHLSTFYSSRRKHHTCILKPVMPRELPVISTTCKLTDYETIVKGAPKLELADDFSEDDSTVTTKAYRQNYLTVAEIEEYSQTFIKLNGIEHNVLKIILNKCHDLSMCEKYKDRKSAGRATTRRSLSREGNRPCLEDFEEFA